MTQERVLYANPTILATSATNLILSSTKTETHTVPFIPAESVKPLQVAMVNFSNTLVSLLHLWTAVEADVTDTAAWDKLSSAFGDVRTQYLAAKAKAEQLDQQKADSNG